METIQSLRRHNVEVHAAAPKGVSILPSRGIRKLWDQAPVDDPAVFCAWLSEADCSEDFSLIVPSTEFSLSMCRSLNSNNPLRSKLHIPNQAAIDCALDKWRSIGRARTAGMLVPESRYLDLSNHLEPPQAFPVVLKPTRSLVAVNGTLQHIGATLVRAEHQWRSVVNSLLPDSSIVEQSVLTGHGVGIELLYQNGKRLWHFCHRRLHEGSGLSSIGGASSYRCSMQAPEQLLHKATTLMDELSWHGVAMVEFLEDLDGEFWFMEINPRLWGSLALAIDAGVDFPWGLFLSVTGQLVPPQPDYRVPYSTRAIDDDLRWMAEQARTNRSVAVREAMKLIRPLLGKESWDFFDWRDLRVVGTQIKTVARDLFGSASKRHAARSAWRRCMKLHRVNTSRLSHARPTIRGLLILCYGNICRSPFAEVVAKQLLPSLNVCSAGFHPDSGRTSPDHLQIAAKLLGVDLTSHRSRIAMRNMAASADIVLLMDAENLKLFEQEFPGEKNKILFLGMFLSTPRQIRDPYDFDTEETSAILDEISEAVGTFARWLDSIH
jgi:protein-tyrosine-phosphatase